MTGASRYLQDRPTLTLEAKMDRWLSSNPPHNLLNHSRSRAAQGPPQFKKTTKLEMTIHQNDLLYTKLRSQHTPKTRQQGTFPTPAC